MWDNSELSVKDVLKRRFAKIASNDPHVSSNYAEIRTPGQYPSTPNILMQSFLLSVLENCYLTGLNLIFD